MMINEKLCDANILYYKISRSRDFLILTTIPSTYENTRNFSFYFLHKEFNEIKCKLIWQLYLKLDCTV